MNFNKKTNINFKDFFLKGKFDSLKLGQTKEYIYHNFPNPDGFTNEDDIFTWDIWTYGDIELHFKKDKLFMMFSHCHNEINGGKNLFLEQWFLKNNHNSLQKVMTILNDEKVDFIKKTTPNFISVILPSQVELTFELEEYDDENYDIYLNRKKITSHNNYTISSFFLNKKH